MNKTDSIEKLRQVQAERIRENGLHFDRRWDSQCCAYNLHIRLEKQEAEHVAEIQDELLGGEPDLLRIPQYALHISVAWVLPVHEEFEIPKDEMWARNRHLWDLEIRELVASVPAFQVTLDRVVATDSAVIAVASQDTELNVFRAELTRHLAVPWDVCRGDLVHVTLFRYARPLTNTGAFLTRLAGLRVSVAVPVHEMQLVREDIFPSLASEVLDRYPLKAR